MTMDQRRIHDELRKQTAASVVKNDVDMEIIRDKLRSEGVLTSMGARQLLLQGALVNSNSFRKQNTKRRSSRNLGSKQNCNRSIDFNRSSSTLINNSDTREEDDDDDSAVVDELCRRLSTQSMDRVVRKILKSDSQQNLAAMLVNRIPQEKTENSSYSSGFNPAASPQLEKSKSLGLGSLSRFPSMPNIAGGLQRQTSIGSSTSNAVDRPGISRTLLSSASNSSSNLADMVIDRASSMSMRRPSNFRRLEDELINAKNAATRTSSMSMRRPSNFRRLEDELINAKNAATGASSIGMRQTSSFLRLDGELTNGKDTAMKRRTPSLDSLERPPSTVRQDDMLGSDHSRKGSLNMSWDKWSQGFDSSSYDNNIYKNVAECIVGGGNNCTEYGDLPRRLSRRESRIRNVISDAMAHLVDELTDEDSD